MLPRFGLRSASRLVRTPSAVRSTAQRRFASSGGAESEFAAERRHIEEHGKATSSLWLKISYACIPILLIAAANAYRLYNEHVEHQSHLPPKEERVEYPYQNIRNKKYPWGNGDQTLFWNSNVNYHNHDKTK